MNQQLTACKQYCLAPAHSGQHKATSPTRKPLCTCCLKWLVISTDHSNILKEDYKDVSLALGYLSVNLISK